MKDCSTCPLGSDPNRLATCQKCPPWEPRKDRHSVQRSMDWWGAQGGGVSNSEGTQNDETDSE